MSRYCTKIKITVAPILRAGAEIHNGGIWIHNLDPDRKTDVQKIIILVQDLLHI